MFTEKITLCRNTHSPQRIALRRKRCVMLARTADNLYWLARYMERADFLARIIEATHRLAALPTAYRGHETEWESALASAGALGQTRAPTTRSTRPMSSNFSPSIRDNPSSIRNCIEPARTNARAVRTALTVGNLAIADRRLARAQTFQRRPPRPPPNSTATRSRASSTW